MKDFAVTIEFENNSFAFPVKNNMTMEQIWKFIPSIIDKATEVAIAFEERTDSWELNDFFEAFINIVDSDLNIQLAAPSLCVAVLSFKDLGDESMSEDEGIDYNNN